MNKGYHSLRPQGRPKAGRNFSPAFIPKYTKIKVSSDPT